MELKQLYELQQMDVKIDALKAELEKLPVQIQQYNDEITREKQRLDDLKTEVKQMGLKHKEKEGDLATKDQEIGKFNKELNAIKTNEAYRAMLTQIEAAKKEKIAIEDQILELLLAAESSAQVIRQQEAETKQSESKIREQITALEAHIKGFQEDLSKIESERSAFALTIIPAMLHSYEHIRTTRSGLAIVLISGGSCAGCNYKLPPQKINETAKGHELVLCDHCSRILYYDPEISHAAPAAR
jgi:hypothetical protein